MPAHPKKGDVVINLDLDPYERSFRHVSTHLFLKEQTEPAVREALEAGRAYVALRVDRRPDGFNFQAVRGDRTFEMGIEVPIGNGLSLRSVSPLPARFRLIRNGKEVHSALGRTYRTSARMPATTGWKFGSICPKHPRFGFLSNPIYVRG